MNSIKDSLIARHTHDDTPDAEQLAAIFAPDAKVLVEAPAGYGKTATMVSKMAYLLATNRVPRPKKILALTFSINAAFKLRREVSIQLPVLLSTTQRFARNAAASVYVTNYHGLCRRILSKYGYLISPELRHIDKLKGIGVDLDSDDQRTRNKLDDKLQRYGFDVTEHDKDALIRFSRNVVLAGRQETYRSAADYIAGNTRPYLQIVKESFLPKGFITFDAILLFVSQLFADYPAIQSFYRRFFPIVFVDEFQDTNILQWTLLTDVVGGNCLQNNRLYLFGDRCQQIYEFIGAIDGILDRAKAYYAMSEIQLGTNHRFKDRPALRDLDAHLRVVMQDIHAPHRDSMANVTVMQSSDQDEEAECILEQIQTLSEREPTSTVAVLFRAGKDNQNTRRIIQHLSGARVSGFSYFYALYSDEDPEYVDFHDVCLKHLYQQLGSSRTIQGISRGILSATGVDDPSETWASLQVLLRTFLYQVTQQYRFLSFEDKTELIKDTLRNMALKQYLMYVEDARVTVTTVHGSKGLEWDHVFLPDMERNSFPLYPALCWVCDSGRHCNPQWSRIAEGDQFMKSLKSELNVFYVASTRARKTVIYSYSSRGLNYSGNPRANNRSCFLQLPGLQVQTQMPFNQRRT